MAIKPSARLVVLLVALHTMAVAVIAATSMPSPARMAAVILVLVGLLYHLARDALLLSYDSWIEISLEQDRVSVINRGGVRQSGPLAGRTVVTPYFIALGVKMDDCRLPAFRLIFRDSLDAGTFRELCVRLKYSQ